jgi:hypothetical protein
MKKRITAQSLGIPRKPHQILDRYSYVHIYKLTNLISGKFYIGIKYTNDPFWCEFPGITTDKLKDFAAIIFWSCRDKNVHADIRKVGPANFHIIALETLSIDHFKKATKLKTEMLRLSDPNLSYNRADWLKFHDQRISLQYSKEFLEYLEKPDKHHSKKPENVARLKPLYKEFARYLNQKP